MKVVVEKFHYLRIWSSYTQWIHFHWTAKERNQITARSLPPQVCRHSLHNSIGVQRFFNQILDNGWRRCLRGLKVEKKLFLKIAIFTFISLKLH
jgi:hypothetical protein